jgi:hypothetical protein
MDQRISLVTLAVSDLDATRRFYLGGLGWEAFMDVPDDVLMIQAGQHLLLSFWVEPHFEAEVGPIRRGPGVAPITIAHNVGSDAEVDAVLDTARAAGADPVEPAVKREWGGYSGYFADPDGYRWEIAHAPGEIKKLVVPQ